MPRHELAMVLDLRCDPVLAPVSSNRPYTVWTDRHDLLHLCGLQSFQPKLRHGLEDEVIAQTPRRIARTLLLLQHTERRPQVVHHTRKVRDDLAPLGVVSAHAPKPQAVLLRPIEDRESLLLNKFVALRRAEPKRISILLERQKKLRTVGVFPHTGICR